MNTEEQLPLVSVLIPMMNEEKFISRCLDSVIQTDYPSDKLEVIVLDGNSSDSSRQIVEKYSLQHPFIRLLDNPKRIQAAALNRGIEQAKGQIIVRMDAHTIYSESYISKCVETLIDSGAANVGGIQEAVGTGYITKTIAIATTSRFGVGDAKFRYAKKKQLVDTVYLGAWHRSTLQELGGYNEEWVINEDYELNYRIREKGGRILVDPEIKCQYYVRSSLKRLAVQYFKYGMWKIKTLKAHSNSLRWRQLAPPAFVVMVILSLSLLPWIKFAGAIVPTLYLVANLLASFLASTKHGYRYAFSLPLVFAIMHFCWGTGFLVGVKRFGPPRISCNSIFNSFKTHNNTVCRDPH